MGKGRRSVAVGAASALCFVAAAVHLETPALPALAAAIPFGTGAAFQSIAFGDANHGWAVGSLVSVGGGLIAATSDGGVTWTSQSFSTSSLAQFNGVAASGPTTAWAVGNAFGGSGVLMATTDGSHWSTQTTPSVSGLTGVSFVSATTGWASGQASGGGAMLATTNGGTTWTAQTVPAGIDMLTSVSFVDSSHGWAAGSVVSGTATLSVVIVTNDGGSHWAKQTTPTGMRLQAINFRDLAHGWAAGLGTSSGGPAPGQVIATTDGGTTWTAQTLPAGIPGVQSVAFATMSVGWLVGTNFGGPGTPGPFVVATTNGGATWTRQAAPYTNTTLYGVAAISPTKAWLVGAGSCLDPSIVATSNGGGVWTEMLNAVPVLTTLRGVASVDSIHAWAVGTDSCQSGAIVRTVDGTTWTGAAVPAGVGDLTAVSFVDLNHGWAVGFNQGGGPAAGGIALATTDGGATWSTSPIPAGVGVLYGVHFVSATKGWAVGTNSAGNQGVIITTSDGGQSWTSQAPPAGVFMLNGVWFVDAMHGWATGSGRVLVTSDGGVSWASQVGGLGGGPNGIDFVDSTHGWTAGDNQVSGQVLATSDGGATWNAHAVASAYALQAVSFVDAANGWVAGFSAGPASAGTIAGSTTAGAGWVSQTVPAGVSELDGVSAASATNAWAVGLARGQGPYGIASGVILGTSNGGTTWGVQSYTYPGMPKQAVLPALSNAAYGGYTSAVYVENLGAAPAVVQVKYFDSGGALVGGGDSTTIQPRASWMVRQDNGNSLAVGQPGSGLVLGSQPLAAFVNEFALGGTDATSYTAITSGVGATLFAPAIANGAYGGYTTGIGLLNLGSATANITVTYRDAAGTMVKTQSVNGVAPQAYRGLYSGDPTLALPQGFAGTATITSNASQPLAAVVNEIGPGNQFSSYDAVPAGSTSLNAPVALRNAFGGYNTGFNIQNVSPTAGTVIVTYYDSAGAPTAKSFSIAANGYLGIYQGTDIPVDGSYTATIATPTAGVALAAIVNEVAAPGAGSARQSTAYNTFIGGETSSNLALVTNTSSDGWSTGIDVMNVAGTPTTVTISYFDAATGASIGTPQSTSLAAHAFWGVYQPTGGLTVAGTRATAVVSTSAGGQVAVICNEASSTTFMSYSGQ